MPGAPEAGVNEKGDLALQIPVLTVPGRGGLDYNITLSYASGIKPTQEATWVGLGWHFDPGSVSRGVQGGPSWPVAGWPVTVDGDDLRELHGADFTDARAHYQDAYYISIPGQGTAEALKGNFNAGIPRYPGLMIENGTTPGIMPGWSGGFMMTSWRPWIIQAEESDGPSLVEGTWGQGPGTAVETGRALYEGGQPLFEQMKDFERFVVTTEDGTRYVFGQPTISTYVGVLSSQTGTFPKFFDHHVSSWRLTAILGADYTGGVDDPVGGPGSWIKFEYTDPHTLYQYVDPEGHPSGESGAFQIFRQHTYLSRIVTPTHEAVFEISAPGGFPNTPIVESFAFHSRVFLQTIKVFKGSATAGTLLRQVQFNWDGDGFRRVCADCTYNDPDNGHRRGRLNGIEYSDRLGRPEPGYTFSYESPDPDLIYTGGVFPGIFLEQDDFGFYTSRDGNSGNVPFGSPRCVVSTCDGAGCDNTLDGALGCPDTHMPEAAAWSLTKVVYPSGVREAYEYEHDYIDPGIVFDLSGNSDPDLLLKKSYDVLSLVNGPYTGHTGEYLVASQGNGSVGRGRYQGGTRVRSIKRTEPLSSIAVTTDYSYRSGTFTGIPEGYWTHLFGSDRLTYQKQGTRSGASVVYSQVETTRSDPGNSNDVTTVETTYFTDVTSFPALLSKANTVVFEDRNQSNGGHKGFLVVTDNLPHNWGRSYRTIREETDPQTGAVRRVVTKERQEKGGFIGHANLMTLSPAHGVADALKVYWNHHNPVVSEYEEEVLYDPVAPDHRIRTQVLYERDFWRSPSSDGLGMVRRVVEVPYNHWRRVAKDFVYAGDVYSELRDRGIFSPVVAEYTYELGNNETAVGSDAPSVFTKGFYATAQDSLDANAINGTGIQGLGQGWTFLRPEDRIGHIDPFSGPQGDFPSCDYHVHCLTDETGGGGGGGDPPDEPEDEQRSYRQATATAWKNVGDSSTPHWRPYRSYEWDAPADASVEDEPTFDEWLTAPVEPAPLPIGAWDLVQTLGYDLGQSGQPNLIEQYGGTTTHLEYGGANGTELRKVSIEASPGASCPGGEGWEDEDCVEQSMGYDLATGLVSSVTSPSGGTTRFVYDSGGRLAETIDAHGLVTSGYSYGVEGVYQVPETPRYVEQVVYRQGNLLRNGSFEISEASQDTPASWTTTPGAVSERNTQVAALGAQQMTLSGGEVRQTVELEEGQTYVLAASMNGDPGVIRLSTEAQISGDDLELDVLEHSTGLTHSTLGVGLHEFTWATTRDAYQRDWVHFTALESGALEVSFRRGSGADPSLVDAVVLAPQSLEEMTTDEALASATPGVLVTYVDGNGQVVQTVEADGPYHAATERVLHTVRDWAGRPVREYLPYERDEGANESVAGVYEDDAETHATSYYNNLLPGEGGNLPYTETTYWGGGVNQPRSVRPPGDAEGNGVITYTPSIYRHRFQDGHYLTVHRMEVVDLEGNTTYTFTDERGNQFLTRQIAEVTVPGDFPGDVQISGNYSFTPDQNIIAQLDVDATTSNGIKAVAGAHVAEIVELGDGTELGYNAYTRSIKGRSIYMEDGENPACDPSWPTHNGLLCQGNDDCGFGPHNYCFPPQDLTFEGEVPLYAGREYDFEVKAWQTDVQGIPASTASVTLHLGESNGDGSTRVKVFSDTEHRYDAVGNLVETRPPNYGMPPAGSVSADWPTTYAYNTRGQLLEQTTPDAGTVRYGYDKAGRLTYSQDAQQEADGTLSWQRYDALGRVHEAGIAELETCASFEEIDPARSPWQRVPAGSQTGPYCLTGHQQQELYVFDDPTKMRTSAPLIPLVEGWPYYNDIGFEYTNTRGRLVASAYKSNGKWQATHYAYDAAGRVERKAVRTEGASPLWESYTYSYDAAGAVTEERVEVGDNHELSHYYVHNGRGLLHRVYVSMSGEQPSLPDAEYVYDVAGRVSEVGIRDRVATGFARTVPYTYDIKGRLRTLGAWWDTQGELFGAQYDYLASGRIRAARYLNPYAANLGGEGESVRYAYLHQYDGLGRLTTASYYEYDTGAYDDDASYTYNNRFKLRTVEYDPNGNITKLIRWAPTEDSGGENHWIDDLSYSYEAGTNRVLEVLDSRAPSSEDWDAEDTAFQYDLNGNVSQMTETSSGDFTSFPKYDERNLPLKTILPGGITAYYRYSAEGQRIGLQVNSQSLNGEGEDPHYKVERYVRDGARLVGAFDGEGKLLYWNVHSSPGAASPIGRIEPVKITYNLVLSTLRQQAETAVWNKAQEFLSDAFLSEGIVESEASSLAASAESGARNAMVPAVDPAITAAADTSETVLQADPGGQTYYQEALAGIEAAVESTLLSAGYAAADADSIAARVAVDAGSAAALEVQQLIEAAQSVDWSATGGTVLRRFYYITDHLGSVRVVFDQVGNPKAAKDYYPFGLEMPGRVWVSGTETKEGFTGHELDVETGHYYAGARYYIPALGRWTTTDQLTGLYPGWSSYNYVMNDPVSLSDPTGNCPEGYGSGDIWISDTGDPVACHDGVTVEGDSPTEEERIEIGVRLGREPRIVRIGGRWAAYLDALFNLELWRDDPNISYAQGNITGDWYRIDSSPYIGGSVPSGLSKASQGLRALYAAGSLRGRSIISIRSILSQNGFRQTLTRNKKGYLFTNTAGEQIRVMRRNGGWDIRVRNSFGNYLDDVGNVAAPGQTHGINVRSY